MIDRSEEMITRFIETLEPQFKTLVDHFDQLEETLQKNGEYSKAPTDFRGYLKIRKEQLPVGTIR